MNLQPDEVLGTFTLLFLAELGDKSQWLAMALAHRYRAWPVLLGTCAAFLVLNTLAVWVGHSLGGLLPQRAVLACAGLLFLYFGLQSWREAATESDPETAQNRRFGPFLTSFGLILIAELGDKTQLALLALSAKSPSPWSVFTGGTLALWCVAALGVFLGSTLLRKVPRGFVHRAAALLFVTFGIWALIRAF